MSEVSIIIPVHNRRGLVWEAIKSCLRQDTPVEIVVVDDGSTDDTTAVLEELGHLIHLVRNPVSIGPANSRNRGLECASAGFVKFLDSDDELCDGALRQELDTAYETNADLVVSGWSVVSEHLDPIRESHLPPRFDDLPIEDCLLAGRAVPTSAALYSTSLARATQWDPDIGRLDDWDFFVQAALSARRIATSPVCAYRWRQHGGVRVSDSSRLDYASSHHRVLAKLAHELEQRGRLDPPRRLRLAQYLYKQLQVFAEYDHDAFGRAWSRILELDPAFAPKDEEARFHVRLLARVVGVPTALRLHLATRGWLRSARSERKWSASRTAE